MRVPHWTKIIITFLLLYINNTQSGSTNKNISIKYLFFKRKAHRHQVCNINFRYFLNQQKTISKYLYSIWWYFPNEKNIKRKKNEILLALPTFPYKFDQWLYINSCVGHQCVTWLHTIDATNGNFFWHSIKSNRVKLIIWNKNQ